MTTATASPVVPKPPPGPGGHRTDPVPAVQLCLWHPDPGPAATYLDLPTRVPAAITAAAGWDEARRAKEADRCCDIIAYSADALWARPTARRGRDTLDGSRDEVREAIVTGLAILACRPRGVGFGGLHWHPDVAGCADCPGPGDWKLPATAGQDGCGVAFTPRSMAEELAAAALPVVAQRESLAPAAEIGALWTADPFCGTGALLVAAARYLGDALDAAWAYRRNGEVSAPACDRADETEIGNLCALYGTRDPVMTARALIVTHGLYGADLDPLAVELAGLALQLLAPAISTDHILEVDDDDYTRYVISGDDPGQVTRHARLVRPPGAPTSRLPGLQTGDALTGRPWPPGKRPGRIQGLHWPAAFPDVCPETGGGFDAVLTNPPFLGGNQIVSTRGRDYREHLVSALADGNRATVDLAVYCWIRAHQLASADGVVAVVNPDSMLRAERNRYLGLSVLEQRGWRPYRQVKDLTWPARSAAVRVGMTWTSRWGGADVPGELRNMPEKPPPAPLWQCEPGLTVEVDGDPGSGRSWISRHDVIEAGGDPDSDRLVITRHSPLSDMSAGYWWNPQPQPGSRRRAAARRRGARG